MIFAVIDTNVFVSAFITRHDDAATKRVVRAMGSGAFIPLYNEAILNEYREVLLRSKFKISRIIVDALIEKIRLTGRFSDPTHSIAEFPDEDDRVFYEVVLSYSKAGAKLVTGNTKHFPKDPLVVSAAQFCEIIGM